MPGYCIQVIRIGGGGHYGRGQFDELWRLGQGFDFPIGYRALRAFLPVGPIRSGAEILKANPTYLEAQKPTDCQCVRSVVLRCGGDARLCR